MKTRMLRVVGAGCLLAVALCRAQAGAAVSGPLVISERWPRTTGLVDWTKDVMRLEGLETASETAQGKAFFEWLRLFCRMAVGGMIQASEGDYNRERPVIDAQKNLFVYGWGFCDTTSRIAEAAWKEYKHDPLAAERVCLQHGDGGYHTMYRLRLDGRYGAFDARYGYYLVDRDAPDARVLDWEAIGANHNILRNQGFRYRSRPFFEFFSFEWDRALLIQPVYFKTEEEWRQAGAPKESVFGNSQYRMGTHFHDMDFRLPKGTVIERFWDNSARQFYVPASAQATHELPFLASGRFYRVSDKYHDGNWPKYDPNYRKAEPYLANVPANEGYPPEVAGGRSIGQAWGSIRYLPNLRDNDIEDVLGPGATLVHAPTAPYLRPARPGAGGSAVLDFYSPYVLVNGTLRAALAGRLTRLEIRTLRPKTTSEAEPDVWSAWQALGARKTELGRPRFNGSDVSVHGVYRFQLRITVPPGEEGGLDALQVSLTFENNIMSIPQIFAGRNRVLFQVRDAAALRGPVRVSYRYQTAAGPKEQSQVLRPADFQDNQAAFTVDAPGLVRCNSLAIAY